MRIFSTFCFGRKVHNLYALPNIVRVSKSRRMGWAGHVPRIGEGRYAKDILVRKSEGKRPLGKHRCIWEDNITTDLREIRCYCELDASGSG